MTILLADSAIDARRSAAAGGLRALAGSLAEDLEPVAARAVWLPPQKARLTRRGGWCPVDGTRLEFDPDSPHEHRCERCGGRFTGDDHYRWWIVGYQLWLAERAVHGAALALVAGRADLGAFADRVLDAYVDAYLRYPNADNVLGPTRPFFSTYLESVWLLQLCVALSLREAAGAAASLGRRVRDRVVEPSARLIASYDEGASNRQVWNNAALLAAGGVLGTAAYDRAFDGPSGVVAHTLGGLLADGSWYEGDNYHLFAHRGLWYGAELAARRGARMPAEAERRITAGFVTPFLTALPDYTFPSRRDSAYAVSLRQWRFAELAELGVVRSADAPRELLGALRTLYDPRVRHTTTERARSTAETERNASASGLTRADLGWRSLLFAREELPASGDWSPGSILLPEQGIAVLRRDEGAIYAALDYGRSGGGHGHPDRLNLLLSDGDVRWQDDVGTGSYTEPTLHWYRSTLAHAAPLVDGRAQRRVDGELLAFDERDSFGLVSARAAIDESVDVWRTLVAADDYVVSVLEWRGDGAAHTLDLPLHVDGVVHGPAGFRPLSLGGADDGFAYLAEAEGAPIAAGELWSLRAERGGRSLDLWSWCDRDATLWRALAPGPPGDPAVRRMHAVRALGASGRIVQLWSLRGRVAAVRVTGVAIEVERLDGSVERHALQADGWTVSRRGASAHHAADAQSARSADAATAGSTRAAVDSSAEAQSPWIRVAALRRGGPPRQQHGSRDPEFADDSSADRRAATQAASAAPGAPPRHQHGAAAAHLPHQNPADPADSPPPLGAVPIAATLGESAYRRSELSWREAGRPTARVWLSVEDGELVVDVRVEKPDPVHAPPAPDENPLDNELADTNADGVQLHLALPAESGGDRLLGWLAVPAAPAPRARVTPLHDRTDVDPRVEWAPAPGGYVLRFRVPLPPSAATLALDVVVNETSPSRERRRGQLVLSGGAGEYVYLRGARQPRDRFLTFSIPHA